MTFPTPNHPFHTKNVVSGWAFQLKVVTLQAFKLFLKWKL